MSIVIDTKYTPEDITQIIQDLTPEAHAQADYYGIYPRLHEFLSASCRAAREVHVVRHGETPVALCGINWEKERYTGDNIWFILTISALSHFRGFSRACKEFLVGRHYPLIACVPVASEGTLRLIKTWGFREVAKTDRNGLIHSIQQYIPPCLRGRP